MDFKVKFSFVFMVIFLFSSITFAEPKPLKVVNIRPYNIVVDLKNQVDELNGVVGQLQSQLAQNTIAHEALLERVAANEERIASNWSDIIEIFNSLAMGDTNDLKRDMDYLVLRSRFNELQYRVDTADGIEDLCSQIILLGAIINGTLEGQCQSTGWEPKGKYYVFEISISKSINIELAHEPELLAGIKLSKGRLRYGQMIATEYSTDGSSSISVDLEPGSYIIEVFGYDRTHAQSLDFTLTVQ